MQLISDLVRVFRPFVDSVLQISMLPIHTIIFLTVLEFKQRMVQFYNQLTLTSSNKRNNQSMTNKGCQQTQLKALSQKLADSSLIKVQSLKAKVTQLISMHKQRRQKCKQVLKEVDMTMEESYRALCILLPLEQETITYVRQPKVSLENRIEERVKEFNQKGLKWFEVGSRTRQLLKIEEKMRDLTQQVLRGFKRSWNFEALLVKESAKKTSNALINNQKISDQERLNRIEQNLNNVIKANAILFKRRKSHSYMPSPASLRPSSTKRSQSKTKNTRAASSGHLGSTYSGGLRHQSVLPGSASVPVISPFTVTFNPSVAPEPFYQGSNTFRFNV